MQSSFHFVERDADQLAWEARFEAQHRSIVEAFSREHLTALILSFCSYGSGRDRRIADWKAIIELRNSHFYTCLKKLTCPRGLRWWYEGKNFETGYLLPLSASLLAAFSRDLEHANPAFRCQFKQVLLDDKSLEEFKPDRATAVKLFHWLPRLQRVEFGAFFFQLTSDRIDFLCLLASFKPSLKFTVCGENISQASLDKLLQCCKLEVLLIRNSNTPELSDAINKQHWLKKLKLWSCKLERLPVQLRLPRLEVLSFYFIKLKKLPDLSACQKLKWLSVSYNQLTELPQCLLELPKLKEVYAYSNPLQDTGVPEELKNRGVFINY